MLATSIAETSLTIEGVRIVIDCGLARVPRYEPDVGLTRLETVRVSRAAADQRRGRAGRTEPGICYRLWDEPQTASLEAYARPEMLSADLSGMLLDLAQWGATDPAKLAFLDPPPSGALTEARALLTELGAIDAQGRITDEGRKLRQLPLPPRLARMVVDAAAEGAGQRAADIAAILSERGLGGNDVDLGHRLDQFRRDRSRRGEDARRMAKRWADDRRRVGRYVRSFGRRDPVAGLSGPHRQEPRREWRVPAGQWPRRQCRSGVGAGARAVPRRGRAVRHRGAEPHPARRPDHAWRRSSSASPTRSNAARTSPSMPRRASLRGRRSERLGAITLAERPYAGHARSGGGEASSPTASSGSASTGCRGRNRCSSGATA